MSRTISDWLKCAREPESSDEDVERCIAAARAMAVSVQDWRSILATIAALRPQNSQLLEESANRTLELAHVEYDVWGCREVALIRAAGFNDMIGARAALDAYKYALTQPRTDTVGKAAEFLGNQPFQGYEWVLLGEGFVEILNDQDGLRDCLKQALELARTFKSAKDICDIALAWAKNLDQETGVALLNEAESMAGNDCFLPWHLANAWRSIGDPVSVERVLERALREAKSCTQTVHVLRAWASHHESEKVQRAFEHGMKMAASLDDWLSLGEAAFDAELGKEAIVRALELAESAAADDEARGRVASAYKQWLGDDESAARIGPRGLRPEALRQRVRTLKGWDTSASSLFDWLRAHADREALRRIAAADYGMEVEKNLAALCDICETGLVPKILPWVPGEVVELTRWSNGEDTEHLDRALCCVLLCLAASDSDVLAKNGAILTESCLALGAHPAQLAEQFFAWYSETEDLDWDADEDGYEGASHPMALFLLFLLRAANAPDDPRLNALAGMLTGRRYYTLNDIAKWMAESQRAELWKELIGRILFPLKMTNPAVASVLAGLEKT